VACANWLLGIQIDAAIILATAAALHLQTCSKGHWQVGDACMVVCLSDHFVHNANHLTTVILAGCLEACGEVCVRGGHGLRLQTCSKRRWQVGNTNGIVRLLTAVWKRLYVCV
jgi:hypothetical protein